MNSTSYMFSFVLGLIVVAVFVVVLNSRFHFMSNMFKAASSNKIAVISPTPSNTPAPTKAVVAKVNPTKAPARKPTSKPTAAPVIAKKEPTKAAGSVLGKSIAPTARPTNRVIAQAAPNTNTQTQVKNVSQIPNTGSPTELLPILGVMGFVGLKLRRSV